MIFHPQVDPRAHGVGGDLIAVGVAEGGQRSGRVHGVGGIRMGGAHGVEAVGRAAAGGGLQLAIASVQSLGGEYGNH